LKGSSNFSRCGNYRWRLERKINQSGTNLIFIGLNPSTANSKLDDNTIIRLKNLSEYWGYGKLIVVNLFAQISYKSASLKNFDNPIGNRNNFYLLRELSFWAKNIKIDLCVGWGANGGLMNRDRYVSKKINYFYRYRLENIPKANPPFMLGLNKNGSPKHPLYLPADSSLKVFHT
tara:strand:+ start:397 stop:921 length:525 start_codon:yes stop_codon:yes gene_type:complete